MSKMTVFSKADTASGGVFTVGQTFDHEGLAFMHLPSLAGPTNLLFEFQDATNSPVAYNSGNVARVVLSEVASANVNHTNLETARDSGDVEDFTGVKSTRAWDWTVTASLSSSDAYSPQKSVKASTLVKDIIAGDWSNPNVTNHTTFLLTQDPDNQHLYADTTTADTVKNECSSLVEVAVFSLGAGTDFGE